jgi:D-lactate dehydrogenase
MKVAFFSSKSYDEEYFNKINSQFNHKLDFFEIRLNSHTLQLATHYLF